MIKQVEREGVILIFIQSFCSNYVFNNPSPSTGLSFRKFKFNTIFFIQPFKLTYSFLPFNSLVKIVSVVSIVTTTRVMIPEARVISGSVASIVGARAAVGGARVSVAVVAISVSIATVVRPSVQIPVDGVRNAVIVPVTAVRGIGKGAGNHSGKDKDS